MPGLLPYPGLIPHPGLLPGAEGVLEAGNTVAPGTHRTAAFLTTGGTSAAFERPATAAAFEQATALVIA